MQKQLPANLETIADAIQALDAIHQFLFEQQNQDPIIEDAIGHAADGAWCLAKARCLGRVA